MNIEFDLVLFSTSPPFIRQAVAAGVTGILVDWEHIDKKSRQDAYDTQINRGTVDDLKRVRACTDALVICRINNHPATRSEEVEQAVAAGADEILLPMVRTVEEVQTLLAQVGGRCGVGILVETMDAVRSAEAFASLPLSRVYVGLNDLALERQVSNIFTALVDGTVERIRRAFHGLFGFGGLTLPDRGSPIPCRLLIGEMARLQCHFSFLRRSFHRDIQDRNLTVEIPRLRAALRQAHLRPPETIARDRSTLEEVITAWTDER